MSRWKALLSGCLLVTCCVLSTSGQQPAVGSGSRSNVVVPPLVNFSGVLTNINGKSLTNITGVTFLLYKEEQGGAPLWMETQNVYPDKMGHYTVMLGSTTSSGLPGDIFVAGEARWLAVQLQGQAEQPRILLLSVPYALKAADAQTIGGLPPSAFVLAAPPVSGTSPAPPTATGQPLATGRTPVTTAGGTVNKLAKFDATADITSSLIFDNGTRVGIGNTAPAAKLDVSGGAFVRGILALPATGTATATAGKNSQPIAWTTSAFNSGTATAVTQNFRWQAEPAGNNTATTSGTLNLLYARGTATPAETGLKIASNGRITFAAGQTFPGTGTGNGSVTSVATGLGLTGGPITTSGTLAINTAVVPQLKANNTFMGTQTINNTVSINSKVTGLNISAPSGGDGIDVFSYNGYGVSATSHSADAVYGSAYDFIGVHGISANGTGVYGESGGAYGVYGISGFTYSVYGDGSTSGYGVFGSGATSAGYFSGNVEVTGTLSKGGGSFKIDHPLDPANKYLYHSFVESPDMMNIYNGNVILDKNGTAWITLPDYFGALNRDFRYQLTAVGAPEPNLYIAQEIADNRFQIAGGTPGGKVSWQVTGIRQDDFAKAHSIIPEVEKTGYERGKYLHPVEHGQPKSMGIDESRRAKMLALHPKEPPELPK